MNNKTIKDFDCCPHCKSDFAYYIKYYVSGWIQDNTTFDGEKFNNEMFDALNSSRFTKYYYCYECNKRICKVSDE